jgi:hypothetical protein
MAATLETPTIAAEQPVTSDRPSPAPRQSRILLYLLIVLLLPILVIAGTFPLARTNWFLHSSSRLLWHAMAQHMDTLPGQNCQVVIFGDSSGMVEVDPDTIQRETGWKTCNIAMPYMVLSATGNLVLDQYLKSNTPPKFIVFSAHAAHLRAPGLDEDGGVIDAWWFVDRYLPPLQAAKFLLRHPRFSFYFAVQVIQDMVAVTQRIRPDFSGRTYRADMLELNRHHGWAQFGGHLGREATCRNDFALLSPDESYIQSLHRYDSGRTQVVFYVAPLPDCDPRGAAFGKELRALGWNAPLLLPWTEFSDDRHLDPQGAEVNSRNLAHELLILSHRQPDPDVARGAPPLKTP